jgi:hypothetical protein
MPDKSLIVSVDRIEGQTVVLVCDDGRQFEAQARDFSEKPSEGLIYTVPTDREGNPQWKKAASDRAETNRRMKDLRRRMDALRSRDQGGDFKL